MRPPSRACDMYVTTTRQRRVLLRRAHRLLIDERLPFIVLHGLGAAIPVAVELALQLMGELDASHSSRPQPPTEEQIRRANAVTEEAAEQGGRPSSSAASPSSPASLPAGLPPFASTFFTMRISTGTEVLLDDYIPLVEVGQQHCTCSTDTMACSEVGQALTGLLRALDVCCRVCLPCLIAVTTRPFTYRSPSSPTRCPTCSHRARALHPPQHQYATRTEAEGEVEGEAEEAEEAEEAAVDAVVLGEAAATEVVVAAVAVAHAAGAATAAVVAIGGPSTATQARPHHSRGSGKSNDCCVLHISIDE